MLRHLTSAARTSFRLSFAKSSTAVVAPRPKEIHVRHFLGWMLMDIMSSPSFYVFLGSIGFMMATDKPRQEAFMEKQRSVLSRNNCYLTKVVSPTSEPVDAATQSIKKPDLFEDGRIIFGLENPEFKKGATGVYLDATVQISNISFTSEYNEICDGLERRGIHVERSEKGARKGLSEYAVKQLRDSLAEYSARKDDSRFSQTAFDDSRVNDLHPFDQIFKSKVVFNGVVICAVSFGFHPATWTVTYGLFVGLLASALCIPMTYARVQEAVGMDCHYRRSLPADVETMDAATQSIKNRDPFENGTIEFGNMYSTFMDNGPRSDLFAKAEIRFNLPPNTELKEIHEGLERRGIHVDNSEKEVRRGLTEYALKLMNEGVEKHQQKKCPCHDPSFSTPRRGMPRIQTGNKSVFDS